MKHLIAYLFSFAFLLVGSYLIVANIHSPSPHVLLFGAGMLGAAALLAIPADAKVAIATVAPYLPFINKGS